MTHMSLSLSLPLPVCVCVLSVCVAFVCPGSACRILSAYGRRRTAAVVGWLGSRRVRASRREFNDNVCAHETCARGARCIQAHDILLATATA